MDDNVKTIHVSDLNQYIKAGWLVAYVGGERVVIYR